MESTILITGGAGFIGSTVAHACADAGLRPVILDDFSTGRREFVESFVTYEGDIADAALIGRIHDERGPIDAVVHCAARILVDESMREPIAYYRENVAKTVALLEALLARGCERFLLSSSGMIYEPDDDLSVDESSAIAPTNPYAASKAFNERIVGDVAAATALRAISLRYFNPIGADPQLRCGLQAAWPSHVLGKLIESSVRGSPFCLNGTDWPTRDGTTIRDYIHVWDLARAHVLALTAFDTVVPPDGASAHEAINLGTGTGTTVAELIEAFQEVTGATLDVRTGPRRAGDNVGCFTRSRRARELLDWKTELGIADGIRDSLRWMRHRAEVLGDD